MPDTELAIGPEPRSAAAVAILMHGRGGTPEDMGGLARSFGRADIRFVLPRAPGGSWYPKSFLAPMPDNEPFLSRALAQYEAAVDAVLGCGVPPGRLVLGGFSQGACLTCAMLLRRPVRYGAALVFTGGVIGPPGTGWPAAPGLAGVPVLLTGSEIDEWVPVGRVHETRQVLRDSGADVDLRLYRDRPHSVCEDEVAAARALLATVAPAARP